MLQPVATLENGWGDLCVGFGGEEENVGVGHDAVALAPRGW
jgi:hypothetical protein